MLPYVQVVLSHLTIHCIKMDRLLRHTIQNTQELTVLEEKIFIEYIKCKIIVHASTNIDIPCSIFPLRRCECCLTDCLIDVAHGDL